MSPRKFRVSNLYCSSEEDAPSPAPTHSGPVPVLPTTQSSPKRVTRRSQRTTTTSQAGIDVTSTSATQPSLPPMTQPRRTRATRSFAVAEGPALESFSPPAPTRRLPTRAAKRAGTQQPSRPRGKAPAELPAPIPGEPMEEVQGPQVEIADSSEDDQPLTAGPSTRRSRPTIPPLISSNRGDTFTSPPPSCPPRTSH